MLKLHASRRRWMNVLEFMSFVGSDMILPGSCVGSYLHRILVGSLWPFCLLLVVGAGNVALELRNNLRRRYPRSTSIAVCKGLESSLPLILMVTFLLVPSTSTRIFRTYLCDPIDYDDLRAETRRYLHASLDLSCNSSDYTGTTNVAFAMILLWPLGD